MLIVNLVIPFLLQSLLKIMVKIVILCMETIKIKSYQSPMGGMIVGSYKDKLCICDWTGRKHRERIDRRIFKKLNAEYEEGTTDVIQNTILQLNEYFAGERKEFSIPILLTGTEFQCRVWTELMKIPYGTTISYGELARMLGNPKGVRAVALANGANPISIIVPCHRVIGSDKSLTGYAGGLEVKKGLISLEAGVTEIFS